MSSLVRPEIEQLNALTFATPIHRHTLHQNVSPSDYPASLKEEVMRRVAICNWASYPDPYPTALIECLASYLNLPTDMFLVGNGSAELIYVVLSALLGRGDHMVLNIPNFVRYQLIAKGTGATLHLVSSTEKAGFALPVDEILHTAHTHDARLIAICSPNNPTGVTFDANAIRRLATESNALLLIDAAYEEFSDQDTRQLPSEFTNVIILRTFSKAMNMAGLRVGYAIAHPTLVRELEKVKLHYVPNIFSEIAATVALEQSELFRAQVAYIRKERARVHEALTTVPNLHIFPSTANFFLMRFHQPSTVVFNYLLNEHEILTVDLGKAKQFPNHLRVSLGTQEQNDLLIHALRTLPN